MFKPHCSNFRIITAIVSGVRVFRIFTVDCLSKCVCVGTGTDSFKSDNDFLLLPGVGGVDGGGV